MPCGRHSTCLACRIFQLRTWPRSRHRMPCSIEPVALFQQCVWLGATRTLSSRVGLCPGKNLACRRGSFNARPPCLLIWGKLVKNLAYGGQLSWPLSAGLAMHSPSRLASAPKRLENCGISSRIMPGICLMHPPLGSRVVLLPDSAKRNSACATQELLAATVGYP